MKILSILILCVVALSSCATLQKKGNSEKAKENSKIAMESFNNCAIKNVAELDDGYSDASEIALALTNYCIIEYLASATANSLSINQNNKETNMNTNIDHSREAKIKASIKTVLKYRQDKLSPITKKPTVPQ